MLTTFCARVKKQAEICFQYSKALSLAIFFSLQTAVFSDELYASSSQHSSKVPAGFENIFNDYSAELPIEVDFRNLGKARITYNDASDTVTLSAEAIELIMADVKTYVEPDYVEKIRTILTRALAANSRSTLSNLLVSMDDPIFQFDHRILRAFIPYDYKVSEQASYQYPRYHTGAKVDTPSFKTQYNMGYDPSGSGSLFFSAEGHLNKGPITLKYNANNNVDSYINDLEVDLYGKKYQYKLGYINFSHGSILAPSGNILGFAIIENKALYNRDYYSTYKTPLLINLTNSSRVKIYLRGKLLYSNILPRGETVINTSKFPVGQYVVDVEKKDIITGETITETQFVNAGFGNYNWLYSGLQIYMGYESEFFKSINEYQNPYFLVRKGYNMLSGQVDLAFIFADKTAYIDVDYSPFKTKNWDYTVSIAASQNMDLYGSLNLSTENKTGSYGINIRNGWYENDFEKGAQLDASLSYGRVIDKWQLSANSFISHEKKWSLSTSISRPFLIRGLPLDLIINSGINNSNMQVSIAGRMRFDIKNIPSYISFSANHVGDMSMRASSAFDARKWRIGQSFGIEKNDDSEIINYGSLSATRPTPYGVFSVGTTAVGDNIDYNIESLRLNWSGQVLIAPGVVSFKNRKIFSEGFLVKLPFLDQGEDHVYQVDGKIYKPGSLVFQSASAFERQNISIDLSSNRYINQYDQSNWFFYPNNIHVIKPTLVFACFVTLNTNLPEGQYFTLVGHEKDVFGSGGAPNTFMLADGETITLKLYGEDKLCQTNTVVRCDGKEEVDLGLLSCAA